MLTGERWWRPAPLVVSIASIVLSILSTGVLLLPLGPILLVVLLLSRRYVEARDSSLYRVGVVITWLLLAVWAFFVVSFAYSLVFFR